MPNSWANSTWREGLHQAVQAKEELPITAPSETLARRLDARGISYNLLHAIHHREEARIVAEAGKSGRVTVATNMAGRGTDILLEAGVAERGGLRVLATERHEFSRIDRQLFGRCARQGDPGEVRVYVSLEDELYTRHLPEVVLGGLRKSFQSGRLKAHTSATAALRFAQARAGKNAGRQRRQVLKTDRWIDESLAFVTPIME